MKAARLAVVAPVITMLVVVAALPAQAAKRVTEFPVGAYSGSITAGPDGNLWFGVVYAAAIGKITTDGAVTTYSVPTDGANVGHITTGPDGNLWFTETNVSYVGDKIGKITPAGVVTEYSLPTYLAGPSGITAGPDGN